jgi:hypothetical protein
MCKFTLSNCGLVAICDVGRALDILAVVFAVSLVTPSAQAGEREAGGPRTFNCIGFLHRDFAGPHIANNKGEQWDYVGDNWNDKISSIRVSPGCRIVAYMHRDFQGDSTVFDQDYRYVGDLWNDQISSLKCQCN